MANLSELLRTSTYWAESIHENNPDEVVLKGEVENGDDTYLLFKCRYENVSDTEIVSFLDPYSTDIYTTKDGYLVRCTAHSSCIHPCYLTYEKTNIKVFTL